MAIQINGTGIITGAANLVSNVAFGGTLSTASRGISSASVPAGCILQVVSSKITTQTNTSSTSYVSTVVTASITPTSSTSKILILVSGPYFIQRNGVSTAYGDAYFKLVRNSVTDLTMERVSINFNNTTWNDHMSSTSINYLDSPATTSSTTYTMFTKSDAGVLIWYPSNGDGNITLMEVAQ